jgi:hypothetical protein
VAESKCAIWGTEAESLEKSGDFEILDAPRAGGKYQISRSALGELTSLNNQAKKLLTTWLCKQRRLGVEIPRLHSPLIDLVKTRRPLGFSERLTATLVAFGNRVSRIGQMMLIGEEGDADTEYLLAASETDNLEELSELLQMLVKLGYLDGEGYLGESVEAKLSVAGWSEIEKLGQQAPNSSQAFVAMWFNETTEDAFYRGIAPAIAAVGYEAIRIDKKEHNNKIDDEIVAEIRRSRFLIADFTCEKGKVRGGVYYEAGFAQGLGVPVIWTCRDSSMDDLHFDTRQYAHIVWKSPDDLYEQLKNRIGATIGDGPLPKKPRS